MSLLSNIFFSLSLVISALAWPAAGLAKPLAPATCAERPYDEGRLFKVSREGVAPSYIFGTMHSNDARILHLPGPVMQAFLGAGTAIFETSLTEAETDRSRAQVLLGPGESLKARIGEERFAKLLFIAAKHGIDAASLDRLKIWAAAAIISQPPADARPGRSFTLLDKELEKSARLSGKRVLGLETNEEQFAVFDAMPVPVQIEYLDQALNEFPRLDEEIETLTSYYLSGNTGWIICDLEQTLEGASPELGRIMTDELIVMRNHRMVERMLFELENGNAFVGIGALHLPGTEGVLFLLERHGYSIERRY